MRTWMAGATFDSQFISLGMITTSPKSSVATENVRRAVLKSNWDAVESPA